MAGKPCVDRLGNVFSSKERMANYYGLTGGQLRGRLRSGKSLKEALEGGKVSKEIQSTDKRYLRDVASVLSSEFRAHDEEIRSLWYIKKLQESNTNKLSIKNIEVWGWKIISLVFIDQENVKYSMCEKDRIREIFSIEELKNL